jgi:hypothetical protein
MARTSIQTRCAGCSTGPRVRTIRSSSWWWGWRMSGRAGLRRTCVSPRSSGHRDRPHLVRDAASAHDRGDRGHLSARPPRVRRPRLPPTRVEVQRAKRRVTARRRALRLSLRGRLPTAHGGQGPKPGHRLVRDHRRGVAGHPARATRRGSRQRTRTRLPAEAVIGRPDGRGAALDPVAPREFRQRDLGGTVDRSGAARAARTSRPPSSTMR